MEMNSVVAEMPTPTPGSDLTASTIQGETESPRGSEMKASGFVAEALARNKIVGATVATRESAGGDR